jgi:hypothetical protein
MNQSAKIIVGNAAGAFSSILKYFSWLEIEKHNDISVYFHWQNKTKYSGNTLLNYSLQRYNENLIQNNIFQEIFSFNEKNCELYKKNFSDNAIYAECYPENFKFNVPSSLKYNGQGMHVAQYKEDNTNIRLAFNEQWKKFNLSKKLEEKYTLEKIPANKKTLCVMLRCSAHYFGVFNIDSIINDIESTMEKEECEQLFVMTQVNPFLNKIVDHFGKHNCIIPDRIRNETDSDWSGGKNIPMTDLEFLKETEDCIIDVLNASNCTHIIGGASNMFLGALCFNPKVKFTIFNTISDRNGA